MLRSRPLPQKLFFLLVVVTMIAAPILLVVAGDDQYEGLELRDAKLGSGVAGDREEARLSFVIDNDGDRKVRVVGLGALQPGTGGTVAGLGVRVNPDGETRALLQAFTNLEIDPQSRHFVELHRPLEPCGNGDDRTEVVRSFVVRFEVFGATQERTLNLPGPVDLPRCT